MSARPGITVVTASYYESALIRRLIENLALTAESSDLSFVICDNTNGADRDLRALQAASATILPIDAGDAVMSQRHGTALTRGFAQVTTAHCLMVDADCRVLARGWDSRCRAALRDGCVAVGAPYPPWKLGKHHDYPGPHFAFFLSEAIRAAGADWRPYADGQRGAVRDFFLRKILLGARLVDRWVLRRRARDNAFATRCERLLGVISKDTGWRVARNVRGQEWRAEVFAVLRSPDDVQSLTLSRSSRAALQRLAAEFELYSWDGVPMVSHCSRTSRFFEINLWASRPLLQMPRFWDRHQRGSVEEWETLCAAVTGGAE